MFRLLAVNSSYPLGPAPLVLLVDDFQDGRELYSEFLIFHGFRVLTASSGREAIELAYAHHPAVILLDIRMTAMSGIEVVQVLRAESAFGATPIVALTAHAMPDEQRAARDAGFDDVLVKPCLPDDVLRAVERLLSSRRSQLAPG